MTHRPAFLALATLAACTFIAEAHMGPASTSHGFAETATGDFYAVNQSSSLGCYTGNTLEGSLATDGTLFRSMQHLATSYDSPADAVWGVLELGSAYQTAWESKYAYAVRLDQSCQLTRVLPLPSPPTGHDHWIYDIATSADGDVYVLVDDTALGAQDEYRIFHAAPGSSGWTDIALTSSQRVSLASTCHSGVVTERAHMTYDCYLDEVVLMACDEQVRFDADTLAYAGTRSLDIQVGSAGDLRDFDVYGGFSVVSYDDGGAATVASVSFMGDILETMDGYMLDVQIRQPTATAIQANPWGGRFGANGYDPSYSGARVHRYRAEN